MTGRPPTPAAGEAAAVPARQTTTYLKALFAQVGFTIDARRGQNFLVDLNLLDLLERSAGIRPDDAVLEVGSGTGALTERLAAVAGRVVTVEIDPRLAQLARDRLLAAGIHTTTIPAAGGDPVGSGTSSGTGAAPDRVVLIEGDVLAAKHRLAPGVLAAIESARAAGGRLLLVANLPYCVATPVISNLLCLPRPFTSATVTVQREMAERMTASAGTHAYNALSVWVGAQCRGEIVRVLPPSAFWPRPQVDSAIVRLELEPERRARIADLGRFHEFVRDVFCHRRKLLRGVLLGIAGGKRSEGSRGRVAGVYEQMGFDADVRAEEIPPDEFVRLESVFAAS
jgi:16S rRNA (adenine1518-N6/adenine1519-N6)-dimethyltransferase